MAITKVWIEEGCIVCNACEVECPDVFHVTDDTCVINAPVRVDGKATENRAEKAALKPDRGEALEASILAAAAACPVEVIKFEVAPASEATTVPDTPKVEPSAPALAEVPKPVQPPVAAEAPKPAAPAPAPAPKPVLATAPAQTEAPVPEPVPSGPYVYDYAASPQRQIVLPKTVPLPSLKTYQDEVVAQLAADEAKWQKMQADYETAKAKAEVEGKDAPKPPVKPVPRKDDNDMKTPRPQEAMDADLLRLHALLGDKVEEVFEQAGELTCQVRKECLLEALSLCREDAALKYEMLADQTGTHYPAAKDFAFSLVYHLTSISRRKRLRVRILVPEGFEPESACPLYPSANWMERETYDMLGIRFKNHPDLTRILCPEDWEGYPLRKEYPTVGLGQRDIDFRDDRGGMLMRIAMEKAGQMGINLKQPTAD